METKKKLRTFTVIKDFRDVDGWKQRGQVIGVEEWRIPKLQAARILGAEVFPEAETAAVKPPENGASKPAKETATKKPAEKREV